jgi:hypothetical protein
MFVDVAAKDLWTVRKVQHASWLIDPFSAPVPWVNLVVSRNLGRDKIVYG